MLIPEDAETPDCHFPAARNMSVVLREMNNTLTASLYWNATEKPANLNSCPGSRVWEVQMLRYNHVLNIPESFEDVANSTGWMETKNRGDTNFTFTGIDRSTYYQFQVRNVDSHMYRMQVFYSQVYFFGQQGKMTKCECKINNYSSFPLVYTFLLSPLPSLSSRPADYPCPNCAPDSRGFLHTGVRGLRYTHSHRESAS